MSAVQQRQAAPTRVPPVAHAGADGGVPVVGLSAALERARWRQWDTDADLLSRRYADGIERAGAVPVMLPVFRGTKDALMAAAASVVARLDALVVTGGPDVTPVGYGATPDPRTTDCRPDRDGWELALLDAATGLDLPVLGICRGMQVMAVHAGGVLDQHVPDLVGHEAHRPGGADFGTTRVQVDAGSRLASLVGPEIDVPCHHHQSVRSHPGLVAVARAADGLLEAVELPGDRFWLAVQWHPEQVADAGLFAGLVTAARQVRSAAAAGG
jgi:putative glutamine amidotransferase